MTDIPDRGRDCGGAECIAALEKLDELRVEIEYQCQWIEAIRGRIQQLAENARRLVQIAGNLVALGVLLIVLGFFFAPISWGIGLALILISIILYIFSLYLERLRAQKEVELAEELAVLIELRGRFNDTVQVVRDVCPPECWSEADVTQPPPC